MRGRPTNEFDTTDGCVGLATNENVAEVARFVRARHAARIHILISNNPTSSQSK